MKAAPFESFTQPANHPMKRIPTLNRLWFALAFGLAVAQGADAAVVPGSGPNTSLSSSLLPAPPPEGVQTIDFHPPAQAAADEPLVLEATGGDSGEPVVFAVVSGPAILAGNQLTFSAPGLVVVRATQAGNGSYEPATPVLATIIVRENMPPFLIDDEVTISNSPVTLSPLANDYDQEDDLLSIVSVSDPAITIRGRDLVIPATYSGTFDYEATDGIFTAAASVDVIPVAPIANAIRYSGLLYSNNGTISGWVRMLINPKGSTTLQLIVGPRRGSGNFKLGVAGGNAATTLGPLSFVRNADGTINTNYTGVEGPLHGVLRPGPAVVAPERFHMELNPLGYLASSEGGLTVTQKLPGGGYAIARVRKDATVIISGKLPDGTPFTAGATLSEIKTIAFYVVTTINVIPRGYVGGELRKADLERTDITGELIYSKPAQAGSKYAHRDGFFTLLRANGCLYRTMDLDGLATIRLTGGNLAADEELFAPTLRGRPRPGGSVVDVRASASAGTFVMRIKVPFSKRTIVGSGVFLPKTQSAWGYFNGSSVGGRIEMAIEPDEFPVE